MRLNDVDCLKLYKEYSALSEPDLNFRLHHLSPTDRKITLAAFEQLQSKCKTKRELSLEFIDSVLAQLQPKEGMLLNAWHRVIEAVNDSIHPSREQENLDSLTVAQLKKKLAVIDDNLERLEQLQHFKMKQAYPEVASLLQFFKVLPHQAAEAAAIIQERLYTLDILIQAAEARQESWEYVHFLEREIKGALLDLRANFNDYNEYLKQLMKESESRLLELSDTTSEELELTQLLLEKEKIQQRLL